MNALIATLVAFRNCGEAEFHQRDEQRPADDEHERRRIDERSHRAAEHDGRRHDDQRADEPDQSC